MHHMLETWVLNVLMHSWQKTNQKHWIMSLQITIQCFGELFLKLRFIKCSYLFKKNCIKGVMFYLGTRTASSAVPRPSCPPSPAPHANTCPCSFTAREWVCPHDTPAIFWASRAPTSSMRDTQTALDYNSTLQNWCLTDIIHILCTCLLQTLLDVLCVGYIVFERLKY